MELVLQTRDKNVKIQTLALEIPAGNIFMWEYTYLRINERMNKRTKKGINYWKKEWEMKGKN